MAPFVLIPTAAYSVPGYTGPIPSGSQYNDRASSWWRYEDGLFRLEMAHMQHPAQGLLISNIVPE